MSESLALKQSMQTAAKEKEAAHPVSKVMRGSYLSVSENLSAGEVLDMVRSSCLKNDQLNLVFVSGRSGRYSGFVRLSTLLRAPESTQMKTLAKGRDLFVTETSDQEAAARLLQKRDIPMLPVVDENQRLQGVLTFDDAMDILEEETSEDIYWKAGVGDPLHMKDTVRSEKLTLGGIGYTLKVRIAFLLVTLAGGLLVGGLIDHSA
ncbi:CBS domain-containing protein [Marinospirillum celere]|uniref:CBS domain-containing protein n=1 Tax=Marinospirillum celere TaxID=1122252 RepID=A0A1I1FS86_9GAMM|nr:CBS domain-containing protein [Marinospirillum celere]SFC02297.1 CBS domain-containing protein [Marinospirillum celere]